MSKVTALAKNAIELLVLPALLLDLELPDQIQVRFSSFEIGGCCLLNVRDVAEGSSDILNRCL